LGVPSVDVPRLIARRATGFSVRPESEPDPLVVPSSPAYTGAMEDTYDDFVHSITD
jgi:hypothetical protein